MTIPSLWAKMFSWVTVSRWLMALCLWAVSTQVHYPTLDSLSFIGWLNASVIALCAVALVLRIFLPKHMIATTAMARPLFMVDVLALLFISYGVLLNINGVLDSSTPITRSADVVDVVEEPVSLGWFSPAGRAVVTMLDVPSSPRHVALQGHVFEPLLIGQQLTFEQYKGFFGIPWMASIRVERQSVTKDLLTSTDRAIRKDLALAEVSKQKWQSGLKKAEDYLSEEPTDIDFAITVSTALEQKGQVRAAVEFLRPIAASQTSYRLYTRYAWLLRQTGEIEGSLGMLRVAAQLDPKKMDAFYQLGYMLKALQRYEQATVAFEKLLEVQPNYPNIKEMLEEMRLQMVTMKTKT